MKKSLSDEKVRTLISMVSREKSTGNIKKPLFLTSKYESFLLVFQLIHLENVGSSWIIAPFPDCSPRGSWLHKLCMVEGALPGTWPRVKASPSGTYPALYSQEPWNNGFQVCHTPSTVDCTISPLQYFRNRCSIEIGRVWQTWHMHAAAALKFNSR